MGFKCYLCEKESVLLTYFCPDCTKIKRLINLYDKRVIEVLEAVLIREEDKQQIKIKQELDKESIKIDEKKKQMNKVLQEVVDKFSGVKP